MYLLSDVALLTDAVNEYSSHGSAALQVGLPSTCDEGLGTRYGPPVKVRGPLLSVSVVPLVGVIAAPTGKMMLQRRRAVIRKMSAGTFRRTRDDLDTLCPFCVSLTMATLLYQSRQET